MLFSDKAVSFSDILKSEKRKKKNYAKPIFNNASLFQTIFKNLHTHTFLTLKWHLKWYIKIIYTTKQITIKNNFQNY